MRRWLRLHPDDDVAVAVADGGLVLGERLDDVVVVEAVPRSHKVALRDLPAGSPVRKYGMVIAVTLRAIRAGEHVHVHNVTMPGPELPIGVAARTLWDQAGAGRLRDTFQGYRRPDGSVGVRNVLLVVGTVNCSATVVKAVCRQVQYLLASRPDLDAIAPVTHSLGCAQAIGGDGHITLNRALAGWMFHPNTVGVVVIGLGCEGTSFETIVAQRDGRRQDLPVSTMGIQDAGGTAAAIAAGVRAVREMVESLPPMSRSTAPVGALRLALNCGGSDGFSGLTANPVLGVASDLLCAQGAGVALAEIPECHGCEALLAGRSNSDEVRSRLSEVFVWWREYTARHGVTLNDNLAPGNVEGGISTIVEKSLGAVSKAGGSPLSAVVPYAGLLTTPGFTLMNTPGFDPVSVTGLVAGGAQLVTFTTGRGSVFGTALAPTVKVATNSQLARRMAGDIDFDAGRAIETGDPRELGRELYDLILDVASGRRTTSEELGIGWEEFVPWPLGETL